MLIKPQWKTNLGFSLNKGSKLQSVVNRRVSRWMPESAEIVQPIYTASSDEFKGSFTSIEVKRRRTETWSSFPTCIQSMAWRYWLTWWRRENTQARLGIIFKKHSSICVEKSVCSGWAHFMSEGLLAREKLHWGSNGAAEPGSAWICKW